MNRYIDYSLIFACFGFGTGTGTGPCGFTSFFLPALSFLTSGSPSLDCLFLTAESASLGLLPAAGDDKEELEVT